MTASWEYGKSQSYYEKWRVSYTVIGSGGMKSLNTTSANELKMVISQLQAGQNYTIRVYGVTIGGVVSKTYVDTDATVS